MNGLISVAFGEKFDCMAAHAFAYSRRYTDLPITILTNIQNRCAKWKEINDVNFMFFPCMAHENRQLKTTMIDHSPYDKTIYIDADSIIQRKGIENVFDKLNGADIMLNIYGKWFDRIPLSYYRYAMHRIRETIPITIYYGAFIGFTKSDKAKDFFTRWNANWELSGIEREMPALACTVKKSSGLKLIQCNGKDNIFSWKKNTNAIIQHEYGASYWREYFPKGYMI